MFIGYINDIKKDVNNNIYNDNNAMDSYLCFLE